MKKKVCSVLPTILLLLLKINLQFTVENDSTDIAESLSSESEESSSKTELTPTIQKPANVKGKKKLDIAKNPK